MQKLALIFLVLCVILVSPVYAYTNQEICNAIWIIEGGEKAKQHYGINPDLFICDKQECEQICLNTVRNNRKRYAEYGYKEHDTYLEFLQFRYCPNLEDLCENWLPNLKYYLEKGE